MIRHLDAMLLGVREKYRLRFDQVVHFLVIVAASVERWESNNHLICQYSESPPVDGEAVAPLFEDLGCQVFWSTTERVGLLILLKNFSETKISEAYITVLAHEDIFWLQISVNDFLTVQVS